MYVDTMYTFLRVHVVYVNIVGLGVAMKLCDSQAVCVYQANTPFEIILTMSRLGLGKEEVKWMRCL